MDERTETMKLDREVMSGSPFRRSRAANDITRLDTPPTRANLAERALPVFPFSLAGPCWQVLLLVILMMAPLVGCAPSRPIPPTRVATPDSTTVPQTFDADQRARLDLLHMALATPLPAALSTGLVIRLAFDDAADLDLFVTDPAQESVYFANSPTRSGGTLTDDRRCDNPSPRVETVSYAGPTPGRYRVGVDFHRLCEKTSFSEDEARQGLYVVRVDDGARVIEREGMVIPGQFEVIVLEFDVE